MTQEEKQEILDFITSNKFIAKRTDGCWFFWSGDVIEVEKIVKKIKNIARRKKQIIMTQEEKQLLIIDLCARLPYKVKCHFKYGSAEDDITLSCIDNNVARFEYGWYGSFHVSIDADYIKPYLRPMSSMTDEELGELLDGENSDFDGKSELVKRAMLAWANGDNLLSNALFSMQYAKTIDWLNAHHFDYRGLIERGLALEAPEGMYDK